MKLDNLFKWQKELVIKDAKGEPYEVDDEALVLYQRIIGDADLSIARRAALRASRDMRKSLRDPDSDEYAAMLPEIDAMDDSALRNAVILTSAMDLRAQAENEAQKPKYPTEPPSDASLEAKEEYQHELDTYDERVEKAVEEQMDTVIERKRKELKKLKREKLVNMFTSSIIDNISRREMLDEFNSRCAYLGTYINKAMTERAFSNYESFENAATELREQVIDSYVQLEMSGLEIKK